MTTENNSVKYKDILTIDFLQASYMKHYKNAEELALSEIHTLELPIFNTLAALNKTEFNKFMLKLARKNRDKRMFIVLAVAATDTFTCMIQNNKFYETCVGDNTSGLNLLMDILQSVVLLVVHCRVIENSQLPYLIGILEKSAERIQNETEHYKNMQRTILQLKNYNQRQVDKENNLCTQKMEVNNEECEMEKVMDCGGSLLGDLQNKIVSINNNIQSHGVEAKLECISKIGCVAPKKTPVFKDVASQPRNAFELMMQSSKLALQKRKNLF